MNTMRMRRKKPPYKIFPLVLLQTKVVCIFQEAKTKHVKLSKLISRIIPL